jgi:hypothetical protein
MEAVRAFPLQRPSSAPLLKQAELAFTIRGHLHEKRWGRLLTEVDSCDAEMRDLEEVTAARSELLLTTYYLLPTTYDLLLIIYCPTTYNLLLVTYYLLRTTHYVLLDDVVAARSEFDYHVITTRLPRDHHSITS